MPTTATPSRRLLEELRAATLESRLEELGVLRSFSRPRVSNDNPYSESLFRTVKYRPDYPSRPFASKDEACEWVAAFVDWYNHRHRHSGIKFVTPHQRHSGAATAICQQRSEVYERARRANPSRWSRSTRCWRQPEEVWINKPSEEPEAIQALSLFRPPERQPRSDIFPESHRSRCSCRYMWKTLEGFWARTSPFLNSLLTITAQNHCRAVVLTFSGGPK